MNSDSRMASLSDIEDLIDRGLFAEAIADVESVLKHQSPDRRHVQYLELAASLKLLCMAGEIAETWPENPIAYCFWGRQLFEQHSNRAALEIFTRVLNMPDLDTNTLIIAKFFLARCALRLGDVETLRRELTWLAQVKTDPATESVAKSLEAHTAIAISECSNAAGLSAKMANLARITELQPECSMIAELLSAKARELSIIDQIERVEQSQAKLTAHRKHSRAIHPPCVG